jgi:hypothetical protein
MQKGILISTFLLLSTLYGFGQESDTTQNPYLIRKGRIYGTLSLSMDQRSSQNEDQLIRYIEDQNKFNFEILSGAGMALRDNLTVGLRFGYGRQREDITFLNDNGESVTSKSVTQGYSVVPTMRNYIPLGTGRIQVLVQTELRLGFGESLTRNYEPNNVSKIETRYFEAGLGVNPGAVLFFDEHWTFETTVGIVGATARYNEKVTDNDDAGKQQTLTSGIDLRLNLLNLNLGIAYYF